MNLKNVVRARQMKRERKFFTLTLYFVEEGHWTNPRFRKCMRCYREDSLNQKDFRLETS